MLFTSAFLFWHFVSHSKAHSGHGVFLHYGSKESLQICSRIIRTHEHSLELPETWHVTFLATLSFPSWPLKPQVLEIFIPFIVQLLRVRMCFSIIFQQALSPWFQEPTQKRNHSAGKSNIYHFYVRIINKKALWSFLHSIRFQGKKKHTS